MADEIVRIEAGSHLISLNLKSLGSFRPIPGYEVLNASINNILRYNGAPTYDIILINKVPVMVSINEYNCLSNKAGIPIKKEKTLTLEKPSN